MISYIDNTKNVVTEVPITIAASSWSNSAPYTYTWTDTRVLAGSSVDVDILTSTVDTSVVALDYEKAAGSVTFTASSQPISDIAVTIRIINARADLGTSISADTVATDAISGASNVDQALGALNNNLGSPSSASGVTGADAFSKINTLNSKLANIGLGSKATLDALKTSLIEVANNNKTNTFSSVSFVAGFTSNGFLNGLTYRGLLQVLSYGTNYIFFAVLFEGVGNASAIPVNVIYNNGTWVIDGIAMDSNSIMPRGAPSSADVNTYTTPGAYMKFTAPTNGPSGYSDSFILLVFTMGIGGVILQILMPWSPTYKKLYIRTYVNSTWQSWMTLSAT